MQLWCACLDLRPEASGWIARGEASSFDLALLSPLQRTIYMCEHLFPIPLSGSCPFFASWSFNETLKQLISKPLHAPSMASGTSYELEIRVTETRELPKIKRGQFLVVQSTYNHEVSVPSAIYALLR